MALFGMSVDAIALVAATAKTVLELGSGTGPRPKIIRWWVEFDGVSAANTPVKIEMGRFSAGITTGTTYTIDKIDPAETATSGAVAKHSATVEGAGTFSGGEIHRISPTSGYDREYALGREWYMAISGFWRMRLTAPQAVNATCGVIWEE